MECFTSAVVLLVCIPIAIILLGYRDRRYNLEIENSRSIDKRIEDILNRASLEQANLSELRNRMIIQEFPEKQEYLSWIDSLIEFDRRIIMLASSSNTTTQEAKALSEEINEFIIKNKVKVKGFYIPDLADKLARLIQERSLKFGDNK